MSVVTSTSSRRDRPNGLAFDVGEKRIGVAIANLSVRFPRPLTTLEEPNTFLDDIINLVQAEEADWIVLGRPRGLEGQETAQTRWVHSFGAELTTRLASVDPTIPVYWIDEALTSVKAESELKSRGKPFAKGDIDALAATFILEDFMNQDTKVGVR